MNQQESPEKNQAQYQIVEEPQKKIDNFKYTSPQKQITTNDEGVQGAQETGEKYSVAKREEDIEEEQDEVQETFWSVLLSSLKTIWVSFPNMLYYLAYWLQNMAMLKGAELFLNEDIVTAYGLSFMWVNAWGYALIVSLDIGFMALSAQAIGNKNEKLVNLYFQRTQAMGLIMVIVLCLFMVFTKYIFRLITTEEVSEYSELFILPYLPSLIFFVFFDSMRNLFNAYKKFTPPVVLLFFSYGIQYLWILLFVKKADLGFAGVGLSRSITEIINTVLLLGFIKMKGLFKEINFTWTRGAFRGWLSQLVYTIPMGSIVYMDWIAGEVQTFFVSAIKDSSQASGHSAFVSVYLLYVVLPLGLSVTLEPSVGQAIGRGNIVECNSVVKKGFVGSLVLSFSISIICFILEDATVNAFTNLPGEAHYFRVAYRIFCYIAVHFYSIALCMGAILRASGKQNQAFFLPLFYYFVLGMPLQYLFVFTLDLQITGSWLSYTIALALNACSYLWIIYRIDWKAQRIVVQSNIDKQLQHIKNQAEREDEIEKALTLSKKSKSYQSDLRESLMASNRFINKQSDENIKLEAELAKQ